MGDPVRLFADVSVHLDKRPDGSMLFKSNAALPALDRCVGVWLERWADEDPSRPFLMERDPTGSGWRPLTFGEARGRVHAIATWLLGQDVSAERPIVILSGNSVRHALLSLAAMHVGVPICPVSTGWSLLAADHQKLKDALALLTPGLVFVEDLDSYARAVEETRGAHDGRVISAHGAGSGSWAGGSTIDFAELEGRSDEGAVRSAFERVGHDTIAKLLFTSGSVGAPKAVITTQRMLVSNMAAKGLLWSFVTEEPPVFLDWLPWSHTFAGNQNMDMVLRFGGTMYLDTGRPTAELFEATVRNIHAVSPTIYSTVPRMFEFLVPRLRGDSELRAAFFRRLRLMHYAGSTMPDHLFAEIRAIARAAADRTIPLVSSWGSTETAPMATDCHFEVEQAGNIGVPIPGTVLKLVPTSGSLEVRVIGPNVTPGYWRDPATTAAAFDEERYYRIGDAVAFVDGERPEAGLRFDGRVSEDFKLSTGTWVRVGAMKARAIAALAPIASDVVVAGAGHDSPGLLVFPDPDGCRLVADVSRDAPLSVVVEDPAIRRHIEVAMRAMSTAAGSSMYPTRCLLLGDLPSREGGEITDKGYINQRAVLTRRADLVAMLFAEPPPEFVVPLAPRTKS
jgi:feruloyl-CoA synthase